MIENAQKSVSNQSKSIEKEIKKKDTSLSLSFLICWLDSSLRTLKKISLNHSQNLNLNQEKQNKRDVPKISLNSEFSL